MSDTNNLDTYIYDSKRDGILIGNGDSSEHIIEFIKERLNRSQLIKIEKIMPRSINKLIENIQNQFIFEISNDSLFAYDKNNGNNIITIYDLNSNDNIDNKVFDFIENNVENSDVLLNRTQNLMEYLLMVLNTDSIVFNNYKKKIEEQLPIDKLFDLEKYNQILNTGLKSNFDGLEVRIDITPHLHNHNLEFLNITYTLDGQVTTNNILVNDINALTILKEMTWCIRDISKLVEENRCQNKDEQIQLNTQLVNSALPYYNNDYNLSNHQFNRMLDYFPKNILNKLKNHFITDNYSENLIGLISNKFLENFGLNVHELPEYLRNIQTIDIMHQQRYGNTYVMTEKENYNLIEQNTFYNMFSILYLSVEQKIQTVLSKEVDVIYSHYNELLKNDEHKDKLFNLVTEFDQFGFSFEDIEFTSNWKMKITLCENNLDFHEETFSNMDDLKNFYKEKLIQKIENDPELKPYLTKNQSISNKL